MGRRWLLRDRASAWLHGMTQDWLCPWSGALETIVAGSAEGRDSRVRRYPHLGWAQPTHWTVCREPPPTHSRGHPTGGRRLHLLIHHPVPRHVCVHKAKHAVHTLYAHIGTYHTEQAHAQDTHRHHTPTYSTGMRIMHTEHVLHRHTAMADHTSTLRAPHTHGHHTHTLCAAYTVPPPHTLHCATPRAGLALGPGHTRQL